MKKSLVTYCFIFLLLLSTGSLAQTQQLKFNLVSGSSGISLGKINSMIRDLHGVMWFSDQTNNCITRFDGNQMTRYKNDPKNPNSLGGTYPECLFTDSAGIIWIGFYGMGVDRFDPVTNQFTHYRHQPNNSNSLSNDTVTAILKDQLGNLWVGSYGGISMLDQKKGTFTNYSNKKNDSTSLSYNKVRAMYKDHEGTIWVGAGFPWDNNKEGGLNRFNRKTGTFTRYLHDPKNPHSLINNKVRAIFEDSRGTFWIGTTGDGLHTMDRKTGLFKRLTYNPAKPDQLSRPALNSAEDHITFITEDAAKHLWIGTLSNGINRYDPVTKKIIHYGNNADKSGAFNDNSGWSANASADGIFWLSTQQNSLYKIDLYTNIIPYYNMGNTGINSFYQESSSVMWYGTETGLIRKDLITGTTIRYVNDPLNPNSISNNNVTYVYKDKKGYYWLGTVSGLNRFNPDTKIFTNKYRGNGSNLGAVSISIIKEDHESNIWVGTFGYGLYLVNNKTGEISHYGNNQSDTNSLSNDIVTTILIDDTHDFWIGTYNNGGMNKMDPKSGKFKHYLPGISVTAIYKDADGVIWVGAENGLYRYNKKADDFLSMDEVNPDYSISNIRAITGDYKDNIWISASAGIYRLNKKRDQVIFYGKDNGVSTQFMYYGSAYTGLGGKIYMGDYTGYFGFYPDQLKISPVVPTIIFTNFWLNGQLVKPGKGSPLKVSIFTAEKINLKYNQNVFTLNFSAIDYSNPGEKKIYYKLENFDKDWRPSTSEDKAYYFNVPPGKYIFRIKAANTANGIWTEKIMHITISSPWWTSWWAYSIYGLLFIVLAFSIHRFQKDRLIKAERERTRVRELEQAKEIEKAYTELKTTQAQLIQSEKMASLGELTAGIAHEIQNPLNFVNNFSEVNQELLAEMNLEIEKGNYNEVKEIAKDVSENEQKINHHGKRADAIVKGMLQHSRSNSGVKEPTDINALADEYLRLAYHGLRAKDKSFNATIKTDFDETIGNINIIPQDIGRVILNLITNAFYAVDEKKNLRQAQGDSSCEPTVSVSTKKIKNEVVISVSDNGNGIRESIKDKIFQPFFTTKPTGQGTGLGLSLSYDIVKAHGGELKVETKEGEGSEFIIQLPIVKEQTGS